MKGLGALDVVTSNAGPLFRGDGEGVTDTTHGGLDGRGGGSVRVGFRGKRDFENGGKVVRNGKGGIPQMTARLESLSEGFYEVVRT